MNVTISEIRRTCKTVTFMLTDGKTSVFYDIGDENE